MCEAATTSYAPFRNRPQLKRFPSTGHTNGPPGRTAQQLYCTTGTLHQHLCHRNELLSCTRFRTFSGWFSDKCCRQQFLENVTSRNSSQPWCKKNVHGLKAGSKPHSFAEERVVHSPQAILIQSRASLACAHHQAACSQRSSLRCGTCFALWRGTSHVDPDLAQSWKLLQLWARRQYLELSYSERIGLHACRA